MHLCDTCFRARYENMAVFEPGGDVRYNHYCKTIRQLHRICSVEGMDIEVKACGDYVELTGRDDNGSGY